jgi:ELWxxDGT repeat protein
VSLQTRVVGHNGKIYAIGGPWDGPQALYEFDGTQPPRPILPLGPDERATDIASNGKQLFYFSGRTISDGVRLMRTDGTAAGTARTRLFATNGATMIGRAGDSILFQIADASVWKPNDFPRDWWMSNGTIKGTALLLPNFYPTVRANVGGVLVYKSGTQLWRTDGTTAGTFVIAGDLSPGAISVREPFGYFISGQDMWRTDGIRATVLRRFPGAQTAGIAGSRLIAIGHYDRTYGVSAADVSGGTPELLVSIVIASPNAAMPAITHAGALAYFVVRSNGSGDELWRTDGTVAGTYSLLFALSFSELSILGDRLVFFADDFVHGNEPWITDGTRERTAMIVNMTPEGVVHGTVTDAATGAPIAGALLRTGSYFTRTDAEGRYTIEGAIGAMTLQARTETHVAETRTLTVNAHDDLTVDFALTPGGLIEGRVTDSSGKPLESVRVKVRAEDGSQSLTAFTSANGAFVTPPLPTTVRWNVAAEATRSYNTAAQNGITLTPHETRTVDLVMTPFGHVRIRMVDSVTGGAVRTDRFGWVFAYDMNGSLRDSLFVYSSQTEFALPDGEYQFTMDSPVYRNRWLDGDGCVTRTCASVPPSGRGKVVRAAGATTTTVDFVTTPNGGGVRATVIDDETGVPVSGMGIRVRNAVNADFGDACITDRLGRCEMEPIYPDGPLTVIATPGVGSGYLEGQTSFEMRAATDPRPQIKVRVLRGAILTGRVTDRTGRGLVYAKVLIGDRTARTGATGYYSIPGIPAGSYKVAVQRDGYATFETAGVVMTNSEKTTLDVTLLR